MNSNSHDVTLESLERYETIKPILGKLEQLTAGSRHASAMSRASRICRLQYNCYKTLAKLFMISLEKELLKYCKGGVNNIDELIHETSIICDKHKELSIPIYTMEYHGYIESAWNIVFDGLNQTEK